MRVLIADDNRLMLDGFRRALESVEDVAIVGATHTGAQVLPLVERCRPELVALELGMRGQDGRCCLELMREHHPDVKVVVLSASSSYDVIRWALTSGARAFIIKSVNPLDIPVTLRHAYEKTVYYAVGFEPGPEEQRRADGITERELTMLKALARGLSNKAISQEPWVTEQTVKFHLGNLYRAWSAEAIGGVDRRMRNEELAAHGGVAHGIAAAPPRARGVHEPAVVRARRRPGRALGRLAWPGHARPRPGHAQAPQSNGGGERAERRRSSC